MDFMLFDVTPSPAVVPVLVGPIQTLLAVLPGILLAAGAALVTMFRPSSVKKLAQILWSQKLVVVPTVAAVGAVAYFWGDIFPPGGGGKREHTTDTWMVSRGGPARLGFNESDAAEPGHGDVNWRHDTFEGGIQANQNVFSSPAVVGNRVYFTTMEANDGRVMCIDADSGELVWQFANDGLTTQGYRATFSSPVVAGDRLVVGEGLHTTRDARVFCLDLAASDKSGKGVKLWEYRTASHVESTPAIVDGKVYVGAGDDGFYCFDLEGDGNGNAKELWHAKGEKYLDCESSPLVIDGKVYFSLGEGGKAVVCLDAETGEELWRTQVDYPAFGSPAIVDGKLVVGMGIGNYVFSAEEVLGGRKKPLLERLHKEGESEELKRQIEALEEEIRPAGAVWCLDVENGEVLWKFGAEQGLTRTVLGSPSIRDGKVYFGSRDKNVYCLSLETGEELHRFNARAPVVGGLSVGEDTLYAVTQTGQVWGLDRKTFEPVWAMELGSDSISSPAVARGRLYVGSSTGGGLVCAGSPGRIAPPPIWKGPGGGVGESGWDGRDLPTDLKYGWQWPARGGEEKAPLVTAPALLEQSGRIVLPARKDGKIGVECIDVEDEEKGEIQKPDADTQPVWFVATANELSVSPVATVDAVFFVDGKAGDEGRALRAVAPDDGSVLWQREVGTGAAGWLSLTPDWLFVADQAGVLTALNHDGAEQWSLPLGELAAGAADAGQLLLVSLKSPMALAALDQVTGTKLWQVELEAQPVTAPLTVNGRVYVGTTNGLEVRSLYDGGLITAEAGAAVVSLALQGERLAVMHRDGTLKIMSTEAPEGSALASESQPADVPATQPAPLVFSGLKPVPPVLGRTALLAVSDEGVVRIDLASGESEVLYGYMSYHGEVSSPMLTLRSHVLLGTTEFGFICLKPKR